MCVFDYVAILHPQPQPNRVHLMRGGLLLSFCFQNTSHFNLSEFSAGRHGKEGTHWKACPFTDASPVLTESTFSANLNVRQQIISVLMDVSLSVSPSDALLIRIVLNYVPNTLVPIQVVCCCLSYCAESKWSRWRTRFWLDHHFHVKIWLSFPISLEDFP